MHRSLKRLLALLCTVSLLLTASASAAGFDVSHFTDSTLFEIEEHTDEGYAFISVPGDQISFASMSFSHAYEHPNLYSSIYTDLVVINYGADSAYPVMRLWIDYEGTQYIHADSVTFTINGKDYTFTGVGDEDKRRENDGGYQEALMIKFSTANLEFIVAVLEFCQQYYSQNDYSQTIPVTIHGDEDLSVTMSSWSILDLYLYASAMSSANALDYFDAIADGTALTISE